MESSKKEEDKKEDTINAEGANQAKAEDATQVNNGPPTLEEMIAALTAATQKDPIAFRRYVAVLADTTPQAPPDLYGDAFRQWEYRHLLTATLSHLLAVFKNHGDPQQHAWWYYDAFLKVNNTDYKDSPFMPTASAKALFKHEADGRRKCARVAAGLPETKARVQERGSPKKRKGVKKGGRGGESKSMLG